MIERFVFETLRYYGPPLQWPFLSFEAIAGVVRNLQDPVFRGRDILYGDGKPVLLVPGHLAGDATLVPLAMWLRAIGYRPTQLDVPINWDDRLLDKSLAAALPNAARHIGRKAIIIAFGTGTRTALRVAALDPHHVSDVISLGLPDRLPAIPEGLRLHVVGRMPRRSNARGEQRIVEGSDILLHINPKALRILSEILRQIPISLLESNENEVPGRSRMEASSLDTPPSQL
jgi:pimeloyl-ACP methyl ester carboxylesterase